MNDITAAAPRRNGTAVPAVLLPYRQFVVWRLVQKPGKPKPDKLPFCPSTGCAAAVDNPATFGTYDEACAGYASGSYDGIGFVFTPNDPFVFLDLDACGDAATGQWMPHALATVASLPGAWEVSQSGKGLHGVGYVRDKAALAAKRRKWSDARGNRFECYSHGRFMAIGQGNWTGEPQDWTETLPALAPDAQPADTAAPVEWLDQARPGYDGPTDDDDLIRRLLASRPPLAVFGKAPAPAALWNADPSIGQFFPDGGGQGRPFDHSSAELALMNALAWWTGCNAVRMERLFNRSRLSRGDTRKARMAITKAISDPARSYLSRTQRQREDQGIGDDLPIANAPHMLTLEQALNDLVFVGDGSHVVSRTTKRVRKHNDAVHEYPASKHPIDTGKVDGDGRPIIKSIPVMRLWLQDQSRSSVDTITWAPGEPEICNAIERVQAGDRAYNLWTPPHILPPPSNWEQWAQPFLQHVAYLVPVEKERTRFLQWIGHIFQRPGELPHTCYLMIATETGIGRGTLASILTRTLRGYVAANMNVDALFGAFNGRMSQKLLATVDEVREGNSVNRYEKSEALKSKITEDTRALNPKYGAQSVEKNCCRWLMMSNHLDALPFDNNDRRIVVIENPTARAQPEWYSYLHSLISYRDFIASIQSYFAAST